MPSLVHLLVYTLVFCCVGTLIVVYVLPRIVEPFRSIFIVVLVLALCVWLLSLIGVF